MPSHDSPGIQLAHLMTGARAAHRLYLDPTAPLNLGKRLTITRMASYLGWDALHYDTMPSSRFNIWHFPLEYRSDPATRKVQPLRAPLYIGPGDLTA